MVFRTRDLLVRQRTQLISALRGHLAEHGVIAPKGPTNVKALEDAVEDPSTRLDLLVVETARLYLEQIALLSERIATLEKTLRQNAARAASTSRLLTMPGIGPVTAMALETFAPPMAVFKRGRDFAAWLGDYSRFPRARPHIAAGRLIELPPSLPIAVKLYWNVARLHATSLRALTDAVRKAARESLQA